MSCVERNMPETHTELCILGLNVAYRMPGSLQVAPAPWPMKNQVAIHNLRTTVLEKWFSKFSEAMETAVWFLNAKRSGYKSDWALPTSALPTPLDAYSLICHFTTPPKIGSWSIGSQTHSFRATVLQHLQQSVQNRKREGLPRSFWFWGGLRKFIARNKNYATKHCILGMMVVTAFYG